LFDDLDKRGRRADASGLLFKWLSNDKDRARLYKQLILHKRVLKFQSRADTKILATDPSVFRQDVYLLTARDDIVRALTDTANFSNAPYQALGSGTFMLALDGADHPLQRAFARAYLCHLDDPSIYALSAIAFMAGAVLPLKQRNFDLVDLAEQVALRFVAFMFGFAQADHPLIEASMRKAYLGLNYQILGRHFASQPFVMTEAAVGMGALLQRVAYLIDLYRERVGREQRDEYETIGLELDEIRGFKDHNNNKPLAKFVPVLRRIGEYAEPDPRQYSTTELAVIVVGLIAGTIGNVQASVSIAIDQFFDPCNKILDSARNAAKEAWVANPDAAEDPAVQGLIWEALRLQPPVAFLPRRTKENPVSFGQVEIPEHSVVILAMGGAARDRPDDPDEFKVRNNICDPLIFGGTPPEEHKSGDKPYTHQCIGRRLAMPLITHIVREVLVLPGLAQSLDPKTGKPVRLQKLWGFNCQSYPLEFDRFGILKHSALNVIMKVKMPLSEHAEILKLVIKYGAPRIEKKLRDAKHVHFAQFLFLENDSKLALFTIYDRDFDAYIEHFALQVGPLFDLIFEHIQDAPPLPVNKFPMEFVETIRRFNVRPAEDYFFSAYPQAEASMIMNHYTRNTT
jgi:cytochrome P450